LENDRYNDAEEKKEASSLGEARGEYVTLLRIRDKQKRKKPSFTRQESWRYKRVAASWRRPRGIDSRMRVKEKGRPKSVEVGYRSPRMVRGFHPSGLEEKLVHNIGDLGKVDPDQVVRISHTVGLRKRLKIVEKARELGLRVLNTRGVGVGEPEESEKTGI